MLWFPGTNVPGVQEVTEHGVTYGLVNGVRVWHGDEVTFVPGALSVPYTINQGPAHAGGEADLAARRLAGV